jgi:diamine N-acetyltransferase
VTVDLRPLTPADYEAYLERVAELDAVHREALPRVFRATPAGEPSRTRATFEQLLADDSVLLVGAWEHERLAGYAHAILRVIEERWIRVGRTYVELDNLAVGASWQRRGIGVALVGAVERWARDRGATELELGVWEANAGAVAFYDQLGFSTQRRHLSRPL